MTASILTLLSLLLENIASNTTVTTRELYYQSPAELGSQRVVEDHLKLLAAHFRVPRYDPSY